MNDDHGMECTRIHLFCHVIAMPLWSDLSGAMESFSGPTVGR
jgi:hypothetical protein